MCYACVGRDGWILLLALELKIDVVDQSETFLCSLCGRPKMNLLGCSLSMLVITWMTSFLLGKVVFKIVPLFASYR